MMIFNEFSVYNTLATRTAYYPTGPQLALLYCACALSGEAGELANEIKKMVRDDQGQLTDTRRQKVVAEIGDVLWYLNALANEAGTTLANCAMINIQKLEERHHAELDSIGEQSVDHQSGLVPDPMSGVRL